MPPIRIRNTVELLNSYQINNNLAGADLEGAFLDRAILPNLILSNANLRGVNLRRANLRSANLQGAFLQNANLEGADLTNANLAGVVNARGANLRGADLQGADLRNANLEGADLDGAKLYLANLQGARGIDPTRIMFNIYRAPTSMFSMPSLSNITNRFVQQTPSTPWREDKVCVGKEDPVSMEHIPSGRGFRLEAENRCYDAATLAQMRRLNNPLIGPMTRIPFTENDVRRVDDFIREYQHVSRGGKKKKNNKKQNKTKRKVRKNRRKSMRYHR